jgi:MIP family channel proteins
MERGWHSTWRKLVAEFFGAFILVFGGSMTILANTQTDGPLLVVVPLGFGVSLLAAIAAFGHVSGGHFNPAVTFAAWLDGRIGGWLSAAYAIVQLAGGIVASLLIVFFFGVDRMLTTRTLPGGGFSEIQALILEIVLTGIFVAVILAATKRSQLVAALLIPLALAVIHMIAIPFSGASVNPIRSLAPMIAGLNSESFWVYLAGPMAGALLGFIIYRAVASRDPKAVEPVVAAPVDEAPEA